MEDYITYEESKTIRLSENFTLDEFLYSATALRKGIDNKMPRSYLPRIQYLVDTILQPLREVFGGLRILSGYRSIELCIAVNSNKHSNHAYAFAADIEPLDSNVTLMEMLTHIHDNLKYKELIAEFFPHGWIHVAAAKNDNRQVLKLKDSEINYKPVALTFITSKYTA